MRKPPVTAALIAKALFVATLVLAPATVSAAVPQLSGDQLARGLRLMARRGELSGGELTRLSTRAGLRVEALSQAPMAPCGTIELRLVRAWAKAQGGEIRRAPPAPFVGSLESSTLPLKVFYEKIEYLDKAQQVLEVAERAWQHQVVIAGFAAPWTGDEWEPVRPGLELFVAQAEGYGGLAIPTSDIPETARCDCSTQVIINAALGPAEIPNTVWHEFNHATQAATDCAESISAWEGFATAVEFVSSGRTDQSSLYMMRHFQEYPEFPLDFWTQSEVPPGTPGGLYQYGAMLFPLFLLDRFGEGDLSFLRQVWESFAQDGTIDNTGWYPACSGGNAPNWFEGLDALLQTRDSNLTEAFGEFAAWRAVVGKRDDGAHFKFGSKLPQPAYAAVHAPRLPVSGKLTAREYGSRYIRLDPSEGRLPGSIAARVKGDPGASWSASLLLWRTGVPTERVPLVFQDSNGAAVVESLAGVSQVTLVVSHLQDASHSPDDYEYATEREFEYALEEGPPGPDASVPPGKDAGSSARDAGAAEDGGESPEGEETGGCGCGAAGAGSSAALLPWILGLFAARRKQGREG